MKTMKNNKLYEKMLELGIYRLLTKAYNIKDIDLLDEYTNFFENKFNGNGDYFYAIDSLKNKINIAKAEKKVRVWLSVIEPRKVDTCTEYGEIIPQDNNKESVIL